MATISIAAVLPDVDIEQELDIELDRSDTTPDPTELDTSWDLSALGNFSLDDMDLEPNSR